MDTEQFLQDLDLPVNAGPDTVEPAFMLKLKTRLVHVVQNYNETEVHQEDEWLREYLRAYFQFALQWLASESNKHQNIKEFDTAPALKKQASAVISELQDYICEFASCYMHLNRFMTLLRDEMKAEENKMASAGGSEKTRWSADAGVLITRYRKEKKMLQDRTARMVLARQILEQIEDDFAVINTAAMTLYGKDRSDAFMRSFLSALRTTDFRKARKVLKNLAEGKKKFSLDQKNLDKHLQDLTASGGKIVALIEREQKTLLGEENRVFLKPLETDTAYNADIKELQKIKSFLGKYYMPYMQYKLDTLGHLKDKLLVVNSLESLMTLYKRLITGIAVPLQDIKTVRLYESEILNHVKYLLTGHFTELPKIRARAEETVAEFRENQEMLEEMQQMNLQEKDLQTS